MFEAAIAAHHVMRAHGAGVQALRAAGAQRVGLIVNLEPKYPATDLPEDLAATERSDAYMNRQFLDLALCGTNPPEMQEIFGAAWPAFPADDFALIRQPLDFLGINYYTRGIMRADPVARPVGVTYARLPNRTYTETGWEVCPEALTRVLTWVKSRYGDIPLYVTENGAAFYDPPKTVNGSVNDALRVDYYRTHISAVRDAMLAGVDVRGYFAWSLLDNFEWSLGYGKRFGIVHVDYETLERTPKASALFYRDVIRSRGAALQIGD
jgi:beta-glucosidase